VLLELGGPFPHPRMQSLSFGGVRHSHAVAIDSKGRLFVADRNNNRIQIFDQDRKFLEEWKAIWPAQRHFHRRQGHNLRCRFSVGFEDEPGFKQGIRIGNAKDGLVKFSFRPLDLRQSPRRLRRAWRRMPRVICTEPKPSARTRGNTSSSERYAETVPVLKMRVSQAPRREPGEPRT